MVQIVGKDEGAYYEITCRNCASRLRFTRSEAITRTYRDYTGCAETIKEITCPCCGSAINVTSTLSRNSNF